MGGVFVAFEDPQQVRARRAAGWLRFFPDAESRVFAAGPLGVTWVSYDPPELFAPAHDPLTGVRVWTAGRLSWSEQEWTRAEGLAQFRGGLSTRLLLSCYLEEGPAAFAHCNGPACAFLFDPREHSLYLWTDRFGYQPAYLYAPDSPRRCVIATHPDVIARDPHCATTRDEVSLAEFLSAWRVTPPHTYYREVRYAGAASLHHWNLKDEIHTRRLHWSPDFAAAADPADPDLLAARLRSALESAIRVRTLPRLGPVGLLVSGGMDSRALLFARSPGVSAIACNLFVRSGKEASVARELCRRAGVPFRGVRIDEDWYPRWALLGAKLSGGLSLLEDNHYLGLRDLFRSLGVRTLLSACSVDWLFKGYGLDRERRRLLGRPLPVFRLSEHRSPGFPPNAPRPLPPAFAAEAQERLEAWYADCPTRLVRDEDWRRCEDRRVRPTCYAVSISGPLMYRAYPYDTFCGDRALADCYELIPARWKSNSRVWGKAVRSLCRGAEDVVDSNWGAPLAASNAEKVARFLAGWPLRKIHALRRRTRPDILRLETSGSWPNLGWYVAHSARLRERWEGAESAHRKLLSAVWGEDPWATPLAQWSRRGSEFFRLFTLLSHWQSKDGVFDPPRPPASLQAASFPSDDASTRA